jgi:hypothetical protein
MLFGVVRSDRAAYSLRVCLFCRDKAGGKGASGFSPLICRTPAYSGAVDNGIVGSGVCWDFYVVLSRDVQSETPTSASGGS